MSTAKARLRPDPTPEDLIRETVAAMLQPSCAYEVRILNTAKGTLSGYFDDAEHFIRAAVLYDAQDAFKAIYFTPNPVRADLLARARNRVLSGAKETTKDSDIVRRHYALFDFDPVRPEKGANSTDAEHDAARAMAEDCARVLEDFGVPPDALILADSGNGAHVNMRIDEPNDRDTTDLLRRCTLALDAMLSTDAVKVDTSTYNPSRIWKLYGTLARKGPATPDRPHRRARILRATPGGGSIVPRAVLELLAANAPGAGRPRSAGAVFDVAAWLATYQIAVRNEGPWSVEGSHLWALAACPMCGEGGKAFVVQFASGAIVARCHRDSCVWDWRWLRHQYEPDTGPHAAAPDQRFTDLGNAHLFLTQHGEDARYVAPLKTWALWDGMRFAFDALGAIMLRAKQTAASLTQAEEGESKEQFKARMKWARASAARDRLKAMVEVASTPLPDRPVITVLPDAFDRDPDLLNCVNGTIDLRTGRLHPHQRSDMLAQCIPVRYDPEATAPIFHAYLERVQPDPAMRAFLQRVSGYIASGYTVEEILLLLLGPGRNGKTTYLEFLRDTLGDYGVHADFNSFVTGRQETIRSDIARWAGKRLVTASEVGDGKHLDEALIKQLTGGDRVTCRFLYKDPFEYTPQFQAMLMANVRPIIRGTDPAIWGRVLVVDWTVFIPPGERDKELKYKLRTDTEWSGFLNWMVQGGLAWRRTGLQPPPSVLTATGEYRTAMDVMGAFLEDCCILDPAAVVQSALLYDAYKTWCETNTVKPEVHGVFAQHLTERSQYLVEQGLHPLPTGRVGAEGTRVRKGLRLHAHADPHGLQMDPPTSKF